MESPCCAYAGCKFPGIIRLKGTTRCLCPGHMERHIQDVTCYKQEEAFGCWKAVEAIASLHLNCMQTKIQIPLGEILMNLDLARRALDKAAFMRNYVGTTIGYDHGHEIAVKIVNEILRFVCAIFDCINHGDPRSFIWIVCEAAKFDYHLLKNIHDRAKLHVNHVQDMNPYSAFMDTFKSFVNDEVCLRVTSQWRLNN